MHDKKQKLELDTEQSTGSKLGKKQFKAVYCCPAHLTYTQTTSFEMPCWVNHKLGIKIFRKNISNLRYSDDTTLITKSEEELASLLMSMLEKSEKAALKLNIQKTKIMASSPIISQQIDGEEVETMKDFIFLGSKITVDSECCHEIKRHWLLKRSYDKSSQCIKKAETSLCQ